MSERREQWEENYFEGRSIGLGHTGAKDYAYRINALSNLTGGQIIAALVFSFAIVGGGLFWFVNLPKAATSTASSSLGEAQVTEVGASSTPAPALTYAPEGKAEVDYNTAASNGTGLDAQTATQATATEQPSDDVEPLAEVSKAKQDVAGPAPIWARRPSFDEAQRYYPEDAQRKGLGGGAILNCGLDIRGYATDCRVVSETAEGQGFGEAALKLSRRFVAQPLPDGNRVTWRFDLPITFKATL